MSNPNEKRLAPVVVDSGLTYREEAAYRTHLKAKEPPLAPSLQAQFFELYLNGYSCEQITQLNRGVRLGAVVRAFKEGDWMNKKGSYVNDLLDNVRGRVEQVQCESLYFASNLMAAAHKMYGTKVQKYLQTGDEGHLGDLAVYSLKQYKEIVELVLKLTGQDGQKKITMKGSVTHDLASPVSASRLTPEQAAKILMNIEALTAHGGDKKDEPSE